MLKKFQLRQSVGLRISIIGFLTLILLIPAAMIQGLIHERQLNRDGAVMEVSSKWGNEQRIYGPVLTIPYQIASVNSDKETVYIRAFAHFLPEKLLINGNVHPKILNRGIYEVVLYNTEINLSGSFTQPDFSILNIEEKNVLWNEAYLSIGITDLRGIKDVIKIKWNEAQLEANPGMESTDVIQSGLSTKVKIDSKNDVSKFSLKLNLNGSKGLYFLPVGKQTIVQLKSDWQDPSFDGEFLPVEREVTENGFTAEWQVNHLQRNYPQSWAGSRYKIERSAFGVSLILPVDQYQKTMRTAKYAIMFIGLTFLAFFMIELLNRKSLHPIQYLLIGFALLIFYTLLLSISEYISFKYAYLIAAIGIIGLITAYTRNVLQNMKLTYIILGILVILYGYLYVILQLQDFALLMGSIGLFLSLAVVMYLTRNVNWFTILKTNGESESQQE